MCLKKFEPENFLHPTLSHFKTRYSVNAAKTQKNAFFWQLFFEFVCFPRKMTPLSKKKFLVARNMPDRYQKKFQIDRTRRKNFMDMFWGGKFSQEISPPLILSCRFPKHPLKPDFAQMFTKA